MLRDGDTKEIKLSEPSLLKRLEQIAHKDETKYSNLISTRNYQIMFFFFSRYDTGYDIFPIKVDY